MVKLILANYRVGNRPAVNMYLTVAQAIRSSGLEGKLSSKEINLMIRGAARTRSQWHKIARKAERSRAKLRRAMESPDFPAALYNLLNELGSRFADIANGVADAAGSFNGYRAVAEPHVHMFDGVVASAEAWDHALSNEEIQAHFTKKGPTDNPYYSIEALNAIPGPSYNRLSDPPTPTDWPNLPAEIKPPTHDDWAALNLTACPPAGIVDSTVSLTLEYDTGDRARTEDEIEIDNLLIEDFNRWAGPAKGTDDPTLPIGNPQD